MIAIGEKVDARRRLFKQMATAGHGVEFPALYDNEVPAWITRHCREAGLVIEPEGADVLRIYVGAHPRELASEIEKLALYVGEGHPITRESVIALASSSGEASDRCHRHWRQEERRCDLAGSAESGRRADSDRGDDKSTPQSATQDHVTGNRGGASG